jgi:hypothetical protein
MAEREARQAAAWQAALCSRWARVFDLAAGFPWKSWRGRLARWLAPRVCLAGMAFEEWRIRPCVR